MFKKSLKKFRGLLLTGCVGLALLSAGAANGAEGGKVIIGLPATVTTFQPYWFSIAFYQLYNQFYNVLVRLDENQKPQPELARDWKLSDDGLTLTLNLREGVMFQSGREMIADDVRRSWERATSEGIESNSRPLFKSIEKVEVVDRYTVRLYFKAPNPVMFDLLDQLWIIDDDGFGTITTKPAGTGPFVLEEFRPGDRIVVKAFDKYWKKGSPKLDEVEYRIISDPQALLLNLESGTVDAIGQVNVPDAERLERAGFAVVTASEGILYNVMFNHKNTRFTDNRALHEVFVHAVDRERFNRIALAGKGRPLCLPWIPTSFAYDAKLDATCEFNLDEAKKWLEKAGYGNGMELTLYTSTDWYYGLTKLAQIIQSDMAQIGVKVTVKDLETAEYVKRHNNFGYEAIVALAGRVNRDPSAMLTSTRTMGAKDNAAGYNNDKLNELVDEASAVTDLGKRREIFNQINQILREAMYTMPVATSPFLFGYSKKLKNVHFSLDGFVFMEDVEIQ